MIIGNRVTNPGDLRTQIILQERTVSTETGGYQVPAWVTIATVWSKWVNVHGQESWVAQSVGAEAAATVTIRYRDDVDTTCAVLKGSDRFEIVSIDDIQERHEYMELKVKRIKAG